MAETRLCSTCAGGKKGPAADLVRLRQQQHDADCCEDLLAAPQVWRRAKQWLRFAGELYGPGGLQPYGLEGTAAKVPSADIKCVIILLSVNI